MSRPSSASIEALGRHTTLVMPGIAVKHSVMVSFCLSTQIALEATTATSPSTSTTRPDRRSPSELHSRNTLVSGLGSPAATRSAAAPASRVRTVASISRWHSLWRSASHSSCMILTRNMELGLKTPQPMTFSAPSPTSTQSPACGVGRPTTRSTAPLYTIGCPSRKSRDFPRLSTTSGARFSSLPLPAATVLPGSVAVVAVTSPATPRRARTAATR
mmetsp:Transcript_33312/g.83911  ORF Transcript_33312/g.83911 Transcript_33312/m.83911 type:complete len:216 (+) Transcript_33312:889-1536(+)